MLESEAIKRVTKEVSDNRLLIHEIYKDFESREKKLQDIIDRQRRTIDNMVIR